MRIILDVLLHGVIDQESIGAAADGLRSGPYAARVTAETNDSFSTDVNDWDNYLVAWSRHILDFEPYWRAGSVPVSPLIAEHPDWFCRDSAGKVSGVYTKAFDVRNREWQEYFTKAMSFLLTELDIDGFRFDARTYNDFPNWAPWARGRAGSGPRVRGPVRAATPGAEGTQARRAALHRAVGPRTAAIDGSQLQLRRSVARDCGPSPADPKPWGVRNAKGLATWMRDREALLPAGSMTAHHIDSHDTFWWPTWGKKLRREQFASEQFRLLTLIFAALPGPFMMFTGGEEGIADLLPIVAELKARQTWQRGAVSWWCGADIPHSVFGISRILGTEAITVLANLNAEQVTLASGLGPPRVDVQLSIGGEVSLDADRIMLGPDAGVAFVHSSSSARPGSAMKNRLA